MLSETPPAGINSTDVDLDRLDLAGARPVRHVEDTPPAGVSDQLIAQRFAPLTVSEASRPVELGLKANRQLRETAPAPEKSWSRSGSGDSTATHPTIPRTMIITDWLTLR